MIINRLALGLITLLSVYILAQIFSLYSNPLLGIYLDGWTIC